jgi:hypothetical protein
VRRLAIAIGLVVGLAMALLLRFRNAASPALTEPRERKAATIVPGILAREGVRVDMYLPAESVPAPWIVLAEDRACPAIAAAMQQRGIAVALVSPTGPRDEDSHRLAERFAGAVRALAPFTKKLNLQEAPFLAGTGSGASLVALLALDTRFDLARKIAGVIAMSGAYDVPLRSTRADAAPFLILSGHGEPPEHAQSARAFARALDQAGAKNVRRYHLSQDEKTLCDLSAEHNEVADLMASFVRGGPAPGGAESAWAIADAWGARAPLSTEPFWSDAQLVVRKSIDDHFRAHLGRIFATSMRDLDPYPCQTYDAIDLGGYLAAHPELGSGRWLEVTNARGERLVLTSAEISAEKPVIVVGIDDERNLFRLLVTYNVYRSYTFRPETEPRPLLARPVGAFLHFPNGSDIAPRVLTFGDFSLTPSSFRVKSEDPLAPVRALPKPLQQVLTAEQGCLQCHSLRGSGARSHHLRAVDGKVTGGEALALEDYTREVLRRFLFAQDEVAQIFGVAPIRLEKSSAALLFQELTR